MKNLNHQYHISGAVKSAVAYVSEGSGTNQLEKVMGSMSIDDSGNKRDMSADNNFLYDHDGNMVEDKSKQMTISYDHRGLPVEFKREVPSISGVAGEKDSVRLTLAYDGAGSRITKKRERKVSGGEWTTELATHYTGIGSEIREDAINNATKVVVNLPQGLGRYDIASASEPSANTVPSFEWYFKNHLGSTMLVYGTQGISDPTISNLGSLKAAYDYRAFGEQVDLTWPTNKVTETFTGKEKDDETELSYFGARYLDQMLGLWVSVDAKRQFNSPYLYAGNGVNPVNGVDEDGNLLFPPALVIGTAFVVKHLVTRVLPRYATKAMDIGMKATNPANVGKAAVIGATGEIASRVNRSVENAFDDVVFGVSNGMPNEVTSTVDMSKTITETILDNAENISNSISEVANSIVEKKLESMQNTPVEDLVD